MEILHEDDELVVVNKPAGLLTIPDGYNPKLEHLSGLLQQRFGAIWVVHRLDKDTSGAIVFARSEAAHRALSEQFQRRETRKEYHAIVLGEPEWETTTANLPLRLNGDRRHRTVVDHQAGKPAQTRLRVLEHGLGFAQIEAQPHTGYTHQIRAHLSNLGLPLLGDPLYRSLLPETAQQAAAKQRAAALPIHRTALHAYQLTFRHPRSLKAIILTAPYPPDFAETLAQLFGA